MPRKIPQENLVNLLTFKNQSDQALDLYFYGDIVSSWWGAWDDTDQYPDSIKNFLNDAGGRDINVHINSDGGSVFAGIAIYNMLEHYDGKVTVYVDGVAASIASVIAMAGDRIIMRTGSMLMIHKPSSLMVGVYNADDMLEMAETLEAIQSAIMEIYEKKKKTTCEADINALVNKESWMAFEEASEIFDVERDDVEAVACSSDVMDKFFTGLPPQYANGKPEKINNNTDESNERLLELLEMEEIKND